MTSRIQFLLRRILRRNALDSDLHHEIRSYFDEIEDRYRQKGHSQQDASRLARLTLGHPEAIRQRVWDETFGGWPEVLFKDLHYSVRSLSRSPVFLLVAVCSLAIGIGANTAMYSFTDWWILRPLPVRDPGSITVIRPEHTGTSGGPTVLSYPDYISIRNLSHSFDGVVAEAYSAFGVSQGGSTVPERRVGMYVSENFFSVLGVQPAVGRVFAQREAFPGTAERNVVLSYDFWSSVLHGEEVLDKTIRINGTPFTVIGVAPRSFPGIDSYMRPAFYLPIAEAEISQAPGILRDRSNQWLTVRARLKPHVGIRLSQADVANVAELLRRSFPKSDDNLRLRVESELQFQMEYSPPTTAFIVMLMLLAFCVLVVACANVAGLLLSRFSSRSRQFAMKLAIGATRWAVVRQIFIENILVALCGGIAGLAVALAGLRLLRSLPPPSSDSPFAMDLRLDMRALLFAAGISIVCTLLFGLGPSLTITKTDLLTVTKPHIGQGALRRGRLRLRTLLIWAQVTLSVTLLIVSAVLIGGFRSELMKGPGFRTDGLFLAGLDPSLLRYSAQRTGEFYEKLLQRMNTTPGIEKSAIASSVPLAFGATQTGVSTKMDINDRGETLPQVISSIVSEDYFDVVGIPVISGRPFSTSDTAGKPQVAIVNEHLAEHFWPGENPLGKVLRVGDADASLVRIVGVTATTKYVFIAEPPLDALYLPWRQHPLPQSVLISRAKSNDPRTIDRLTRQVVSSIDSGMPVFDLRSMHDLYLDRAVKTPHVITKATAAFGVMGLILSLVGLYGLISYQVAQRTCEIGVRIALGAVPRSIVFMIVRSSLRVVVMGSVTGLCLGALASKGIRSSLFLDIGRTQILPYVWVFGAVLITTVISALGPASRAASIDPMLSLRED